MFKDSDGTFGAVVRKNSWDQELLHSKIAGAERVTRIRLNSEITRIRDVCPSALSESTKN